MSFTEWQDKKVLELEIRLIIIAIINDLNYKQTEIKITNNLCILDVKLWSNKSKLILFYFVVVKRDPTETNLVPTSRHNFNASSI